MSLACDGNGQILPNDLIAEVNKKQVKLVAGTNITIDETDPLLPVISSAGSAGGVVEEEDQPIFTPDFGVANYFEYTIKQDCTIANPINSAKGQRGTIVLIQDDIGDHTVTWGDRYNHFEEEPNLTLAKNEKDVFNFIVNAKVDMHYLSNENTTILPPVMIRYWTTNNAILSGSLVAENGTPYLVDNGDNSYDLCCDDAGCTFIAIDFEDDYYYYNYEMEVTKIEFIKCKGLTSIGQDIHGGGDDSCTIGGHMDVTEVLFYEPMTLLKARHGFVYLYEISSLDLTKLSFKDADCYKLFKGCRADCFTNIDTTNASNTSDMFSGTIFTQPDVTAQTDIINGAVWTHPTTCP